MELVTLGERIAAARKKKGLTQKELAALAGVSITSMNRYEKNVQQPSLETVTKIAKITDTELEWFAPEMQSTSASAPVEEKKEHPRRIETDLIQVPVISREITVCCGRGIGAFDITNPSNELIYIARSEFRVFDDMRPPFAIFCEGDCLESDGIYDKSRVIINPAEEPINGAVALVSISGLHSLKHVFRLQNGVVILKSDDGERRLNPEQQEEDDFYIVGAMVAFYGKPSVWTL